MTDVPPSRVTGIHCLPGARRSLGIYGGTFDPIHLGHVQVANEVRAALSLDQVIFVPARQSPTKVPPVASVADRVAMARLATCHLPWATVSTIEADRSPPSFTIDTVLAVRDEAPDADLFLIVGADALAEFPSWRDPAGILAVATLVAVGRGGGRPVVPVELAPGGGQAGAGRLLMLEAITPGIASSEVRSRASRGESLDGLVPGEVARYVAERDLYRVTTRAETHGVEARTG